MVSNLMYHLYILKCADGTLYTGITTDVKRRVGEHNGEDEKSGKAGKGAKYTSARRPVVVVYTKRFKDRSKASKEEARIKKLSRADKLALIESYKNK